MEVWLKLASQAVLLHRSVMAWCQIALPFCGGLVHMGLETCALLCVALCEPRFRYVSALYVFVKLQLTKARTVQL